MPEDSPCSTCSTFHSLRDSGDWLSREEIFGCAAPPRTRLAALETRLRRRLGPLLPRRLRQLASLRRAYRVAAQLLGRGEQRLRDWWKRD